MNSRKLLLLLQNLRKTRPGSSCSIIILLHFSGLKKVYPLQFMGFKDEKRLLKADVPSGVSTASVVVITIATRKKFQRLQLLELMFLLRFGITRLVSSSRFMEN